MTPTGESSRRFGVFAQVVAILGPILYVVCELKNWPLFTYHPGPNRLDWLFAPAVRDWGPAMYWYGWTASALVGAGVAGGLAAFLPERIAERLADCLADRIPRGLGWLVALFTIPPLVYGLRFYWR